MKLESVLGATLAAAVFVGGCEQHQSRVGAQRHTGSKDTVRIATLTPGTDAPLRVGDKVTLRVEVAYTLTSADTASIVLVVQRGESGQLPLANETRVVEKGSGSVTLVKELEIPDTAALLVFTPLSIQGSASTNVVDSRAYKVIKG